MYGCETGPDHVPCRPIPHVLGLTIIRHGTHITVAVNGPTRRHPDAPFPAPRWCSSCIMTGPDHDPPHPMAGNRPRSTTDEPAGNGRPLVIRGARIALERRQGALKTVGLLSATCSSRGRVRDDRDS